MSSAGPCRQIDSQDTVSAQPHADIQRQTESGGAAAVGAAAVSGVFTNPCCCTTTTTSSPAEPAAVRGSDKEKSAGQETHTCCCPQDCVDLSWRRQPKHFKGVINCMGKAEQALHVNSHGKQLVMPLFVKRWLGGKKLFLIMNRNAHHILDANLSALPLLRHRGYQQFIEGTWK